MALLPPSPRLATTPSPLNTTTTTTPTASTITTATTTPTTSTTSSAKTSTTPSPLPSPPPAYTKHPPPVPPLPRRLLPRTLLLALLTLTTLTLLHHHLNPHPTTPEYTHMTIDTSVRTGTYIPPETYLPTLPASPSPLAITLTWASLLLLFLPTTLLSLYILLTLPPTWLRLLLLLQILLALYVSPLYFNLPHPHRLHTWHNKTYILQPFSPLTRRLHEDPPFNPNPFPSPNPNNPPNYPSPFPPAHHHYNTPYPSPEESAGTYTMPPARILENRRWKNWGGTGFAGWEVMEEGGVGLEKWVGLCAVWMGGLVGDLVGVVWFVGWGGRWRRGREVGEEDGVRGRGLEKLL